jgi:hypothetical protein
MSPHILYEVEALADIKRALFFDGRYDERDFAPGSIRRARGNGLLEAFVMHVRCSTTSYTRTRSPSQEVGFHLSPQGSRLASSRSTAIV